MPTKPMPTKSINNIDTANMLNALAVESGVNAPKVVNGDISSLKTFGRYVTQYQATQNNFINALVNRIGRVIITSRLYKNPWSIFKKGLLEYGETIEEIFVAMAKPYTFDPEKTENTDFKRYIPDVKAVFHTLNFQKFYPTTVSEAELRQAFLSFEGVNDLITRIIEQVYTGANYDEFVAMKYLLARAILDGNVHSVNIPEINADNARAVTTTMVNYARKMGYMSTAYNTAGVNTYSDISKLYMIITADIQSILDVEVLALSFNMDKAELLGRQIGVDSFGDFDTERLNMLFGDDPNYIPLTTDDINNLKTIAGVLCDESFFMIFDNNIFMTSIFSPVGLYWTYYYHTWKTFSTSPFANAVVFTTQNPAITSVTISPATATVDKGQSIKFTADVVTTGFADTSVFWEVTGSDIKSTITQDGVLTVGTSETETALTVKATSKYDSTKSGTATVTINQ